MQNCMSIRTNNKIQHYSEMIILDAHRKVYHNGIRETLNAVKLNYWILRGREQIEKLVKQCIICKRLEGLPFRYNCTPALPEIRAYESPPFYTQRFGFRWPLDCKIYESTQG